MLQTLRGSLEPPCKGTLSAWAGCVGGHWAQGPTHSCSACLHKKPHLGPGPHLISCICATKKLWAPSPLPVLKRLLMLLKGAGPGKSQASPALFTSSRHVFHGAFVQSRQIKMVPVVMKPASRAFMTRGQQALVGFAVRPHSRSQVKLNIELPAHCTISDPSIPKMNQLK